MEESDSSDEEGRVEVELKLLPKSGEKCQPKREPPSCFFSVSQFDDFPNRDPPQPCSSGYSFDEPDYPANATNLQDIARESGLMMMEDRRSTELYHRRLNSLRDLYHRRTKRTPEAMRNEEYYRFVQDSPIYRCSNLLANFVLSEEKVVFVDNPFPESEVLTMLRTLVTLYEDVPATVLYVNSNESMLDSLLWMAKKFFLVDDVCSTKNGEAHNTSIVAFHGYLNPSIKNLFKGSRTITDEGLPEKFILYPEKAMPCLPRKDYLDDILSIVRYLVATQLNIPCGTPFGSFTQELRLIEGDILVFAVSATEALMLQYALKQDFEWFAPWYKLKDPVKVVCLTEYNTINDLMAAPNDDRITIFIATDNATNIPRVPYVLDSGVVRRNYFNTSVASYCTELVPISKYSAGRRASYAISLMSRPRVDEVSIQAGGVVFRLYPFDQLSTLKAHDQLIERNGESELISMYNKELKLNWSEQQASFSSDNNKFQSRACNKTIDLQFAREMPFMNPEYLAFLRDSEKASAVDLSRKLFIVTVLSLDPVFCCGREAKFLLDEDNKYSSARYFSRLFEKIVNWLQGVRTKERCFAMFKRVASYVKARVDAYASALLQQCELNDDSLDDWTEYLTTEDVKHLYTLLHRREVHVYELKTERNVKYAVALEQSNGVEFILQPCDGIDFFETNTSFETMTFAFHLLEEWNESFYILSAVTSMEKTTSQNHKTCDAYQKLHVGPHGRQFLLPSGVNTVPLSYFCGPRDVFLSSVCAHDPHTDLFLVGTADADLDSAAALINQTIATKYSELLNETWELGCHGVNKKNSSTVIVGAGGVTLEHLLSNEGRHVYNEKVVYGEAVKRERRITHENFGCLGDPTIVNPHDLLPVSSGLTWNLTKDVTSRTIKQSFQNVQRKVKLRTRTGKYCGVKCSHPRLLDCAVGKIVICGPYIARQVISALLHAFPNSVIACKRYAGIAEMESLMRWESPELEEEHVYVFDLSLDVTTIQFANVARFALQPFGYNICEAFITVRGEDEKKVFLAKVDSLLQSSFQKIPVERQVEVLRTDFEVKKTHNAYIWCTYENGDLHDLTTEMRKAARSRKQKTHISINTVYRQFYLLSHNEYMVYQTAITQLCLDEMNGDVDIEVRELPDGHWIVNLECCNIALLGRACRKFVKIQEFNKRLRREQYPALFTRKGLAWLASLQDAFWPYLRVVFPEKPSTAVDLLMDPKIRDSVGKLVKEYCGKNWQKPLPCDSEQSSCCACFHTDEERKVVLECGHTICEECRDSWINVCVSEGSFPLCCPELDCQKIVVWKDIERWLICGKEDCFDCGSHDEIKKLSRSSYRHYLNGLRDLHLLCSTPDCIGYFTKRMAEGRQNEKCLECNVMKCMSCGACTHDEISCEENEAMTNDSERGLQYWIQKDPKNRKSCVVCKMLIVKDAGGGKIIVYTNDMEITRTNPLHLTPAQQLEADFPEHQGWVSTGSRVYGRIGELFYPGVVLSIEGEMYRVYFVDDDNNEFLSKNDVVPIRGIRPTLTVDVAALTVAINYTPRRGNPCKWIYGIFKGAMKESRAYLMTYSQF
ncbi:hypothetical protein QR680_000455 [Steinernema hermaphroditum]|uniref:RING-type domain-containing protein n=1 Tax=Steinernema hermaphroditum TaxID=289476 RepID=A0AA39LE74_9BILA|nr:hypothetical protein QR680_000455 [Steinernema hermaphroditum]